jgi:hypothetical protein
MALRTTTVLEPTIVMHEQAYATMHGRRPAAVFEIKN